MTIKPVSKRRQAPVPLGAAYITAPQLLDRYGGRSHMWLERMLERDPRFPRPKYFGRLRFFKIDKLEQYERDCAANQTEIA